MAEEEKQVEQPIEDKPKHAGGRPLAYRTPQELEAAIDRYFALCDPHTEKQMAQVGTDQKGYPIFDTVPVLTEQKPYLLSGLARALGVDRKTIKNYTDREEFFPTIDGARRRCEEYAESMLFSQYSSGAKFNLNNNYDDWREKQEIDHTSKGESIQPKIVSEIAPRNATAQAQTAPADTTDQQPAD
jgi:hypothetical protein